VSWREFAAGAPELAAFAEERLRDTGILILGTNRADGWPRISPCEAYVAGGELMLGMMPRSKKALDLLRDPRISLATPQAHHDAPFGDLKLYGRAAEVHDRARKGALEDAQEAAINWRPTEPYHAFVVEIERAGFISFGKDRRMMRWSVTSGFEVLRHPDAARDDA
jgi:Pyridoxamine 5'-phosphate oxidase